MKALKKSFNKASGKVVSGNVFENDDGNELITPELRSEISNLKNAYFEQKQTLTEVFDRAVQFDTLCEVRLSKGHLEF